MTTLPVVTDGFRSTIKWQSFLTGRIDENVMAWVGSPGSEADLSAKITGNLTASCLTSTSSDFTLIEVDVIKLDGTSGTRTFPIASGIQGQGGGDYAPQVATLIHLGTGLRGPARRGRVYLPGCAENAQTAGTITSSLVTSMQTAWDAFLTNMATDGYGWGVLSIVNADIALVTDVVVRPRVATQRRRNDF